MSWAGLTAVLAGLALAGPAGPNDEERSRLKSRADLESGGGVSDPSLKLSEADMAWWRDAKFGMFIHWGLYAIPARGEWVMHQEHIAATEYAKLADEFNPRKYDPDAWAKAAKDAGMTYMVLTARHHDGFALWDSPASWGGFCAAKKAAGRDLVRPYVEAARRAGLRVGLYYSPMDWRFPGYFKPKELPDNARLMKRQGWGQVEELVGNYGPIDILWYDGGWLAHQGTDADAAWFWEPVKLNRMVRSHQPRVVISPRSGWVGDFKCDEGGHEVSGPIRPEPWEKCLNLNQTSWGYTDRQNLMTADQVVRMLVNTVVRGGNVLLNVGPDRDGVIPAAHVARLAEVGRWVAPRAEAIYGTRAGPLEPVDGVYGTTRKGNRVFVFVLGWPAAGPLRLPVLPGRVISARVLPGGTASCVPAGEGVELAVPAAARDPVVTVVALELGG